MALRVILTLLVLVLFTLAAAIVTGQFDVHPALGLPLALVAVLVAAYVMRKGKR